MGKAEQAANKWSQESEKRYGYVNPALAYLEGISDYKASLRAEIEKRKDALNNSDKEHDVVRWHELRRTLELLENVTP